MNAAVLFFDIRGSSTRSGLVALYTLDTVVPMVMRIVHDHGGYVEKNTGDGIMAILTGMDEKKAAENALSIALACFNVIQNMINPHLVQVGIPAVDARIGIDFGKILVARIGVHQGSADKSRSFLTAVGSAANIACRLQEQADTNQIWVGDALRTRGPQIWQQYFKLVRPTEWTWVSEGTSTPYLAWHFEAHYTKIQLPVSASRLITAPPSALTPLDLGLLSRPQVPAPLDLTPSGSILRALLNRKG
jgi:class 3 adenylate cyclase